MLLNITLFKSNNTTQSKCPAFKISQLHFFVDIELTKGRLSL